ncbi:hypothetical protein Anapl_09149 [Anas platyrhynchos]|uniref:Uncharacterized protein n=1 Tax=Anas platyrhynchos TaxID=8839 RepID=R0LPD5_ANAPL|nr:hypothetical protein Anapl_09149 [Anas platyrhynchos]
MEVLQSVYFSNTTRDIHEQAPPGGLCKPDRFNLYTTVAPEETEPEKPSSAPDLCNSLLVITPRRKRGEFLLSASRRLHEAVQLFAVQPQPSAGRCGYSDSWQLARSDQESTLSSAKPLGSSSSFYITVYLHNTARSPGQRRRLSEPRVTFACRASR